MLKVLGRRTHIKRDTFLLRISLKQKGSHKIYGVQESLRGIQDFFTPHQGGGIFYSSSEEEHDFFQPMVKGWGAGFF